ncbi:MAG: SBBP repeat-containing protein [Bacteroidetes bacterium]|nr:SBBP repeat-containing protein [Bacteroidota bacterium]
MGKGLGGNKSESSYAITTDASSNLYITGCFGSDSIIIGNVTLYNDFPPYDEYFVAKLDSNGNGIWAHKACGVYQSWDMGNSIALDSLGNIYVAGQFHSDSITFGNIVLHNMSNPVSNQIFIVKYDPSGNVLWAKKFGGNHSNIATGITIDAFNNAYITGDFNCDSIHFDNFILHSHSGANGNYFIAKLAPDGSVPLGKQSGWASPYIRQGNYDKRKFCLHHWRFHGRYHKIRKFHNSPA